MDAAALRDAVDEADLRVLLLCLYQLTGDERWLRPPFVPCRDVRLVADEAAGLDPAAQREVRDAAVELLADGIPAAAVPDPDDATLLRMMRHCVGEEVDEAYVPMMREQLGFSPVDVAWSDGSAPDGVADVVIVGAGVSGIALGAQLTRLGVPYTVFEKHPEVGGVWYENRYPGCGVDTPNHVYSYSFGAPEPWSRYFSHQPEIHGYLSDRAAAFGVTPNIRFETEVVSATWDEHRLRWRVETRDRSGSVSVTEAAVLVSAIGQMNRPQIPDIPGRDDFAGVSFHSARWPAGLDVEGRRVAVVGTGASAMQIVPAIAGRAEHVDVYQRSPQWIRPIPEYRREVGAGAQWLLQNVPFYARWFRFSLLWRFGDGLLPFLQKDPDWPHPERSLNRVNDRHRAELTDFVVESLAGHPELVERCVPSYPPYGKRMLMDSGWFEAITRPDVSLVTDPIARVSATGIVTADDVERPCDVLVWATGFHVTDLTARLGIAGRGGRTLAEAWADDNPTAYLGITVPGFPNLFCMYGPNTNLGHGGSIIIHAECQARYIADAVVKMAERDVAALDCRPEALESWVRRVDDAHERMIWTHPGMTTWYRNAAGRVVSTSPFRLVDYWAMTHHVDLSDYRLLQPTLASTE